MGIFEQKNADYGNADRIGVMRDVRLATGILSEERRQFFEMKVLKLLAQDPSRGAEVRNALFGAKDQVVQEHEPNISQLVGADKTNKNYHKLLALREMLLANPTATLRALDESITHSLSKFGVTSADVEIIGKIIERTSEENFYENCDTVEKQLGHTGIIFFLEGCITSGKFIQSCINRAQKGVDQYNGNKKSFEYWNFRNVLRLGETRYRLTPEKDNTNEKSFVLSAGSGNAIAGLGVIKAHLDAGGTIRMISGTSMGSTIGAFVGKIGNNAQELGKFMDDVQNGFNYEGSYWSLPGNAHNGKKMVIFLKVLGKKWGIDENTRFSDLEIPVLVNAGRQYRNGEQEVVLGGGDKVMPALLASMNIPLPLLSNTGILGRNKIDGVAMIDYASNERGNPTHWSQSLGIKDSDIYVVDAGYSSETWTEKRGTDIRARFPRATERDFEAKLRISSHGGPVRDINPESSGSKGGIKLSPEIIGRLYGIGAQSYISTSQPQQ